MDFIIIMPAFNEAERIQSTLECLAGQTLAPKRLIVVNDGSTDATPDIVEDFSRKHSSVSLINKKVNPQHGTGGKVVRAFYTGFEAIEETYDIIVKMDADLNIPANYFERVAKIFQKNPKVGIAGGGCLIEENGKWVNETYTDLDHIKGACKSYRKECFEAIGGLKESIGWDSVDEMLALYHGWELKVDPELQLKHLRLRGQETGFIKIMVKIGYAMYRMRYGFFIALISAGKAGFVNRPFILTGFATMYGFMKAWLRGDQFIVNQEEGSFIRQFRMKRMLKKITSPK